MFNCGYILKNTTFFNEDDKKSGLIEVKLEHLTGNI
ncbi:MAG: hypothetical protein CFH21_01107 [Alphaproteobacteria bacterium MarineAlpha5_Bin11]|nr:MAG: hypothetical protein CFH21_01107 [Alphaproteobacteria bacterium MarineAlpha5_Bin11]PPR51870.1 MAG: hypothetical protein CFH20_00289 [Alphaproteobacteria bacterium MarineAlpha5_Bin10]